MAGFLQGRISKYSRNGTPDQYYPQAGPARREGQLPLKGQTGFGNAGSGYIPSEPSPLPIDYLATQNNNQITTEDGNNIILQ